MNFRRKISHSLPNYEFQEPNFIHSLPNYEFQAENFTLAGAELTLSELEPCTSYRIEVISMDDNFIGYDAYSAPLVKYVRTKPDGRPVQPLR